MGIHTALSHKGKGQSRVARILQELRAELRAQGGRPRPAAGSRFFTAEAEGTILGMKTATLRKIAATCSAAQTPPLSKREVFELAEELLHRKINDESVIAIAMLRRIHQQFEEADLKIFERWLRRHVVNWGMCDDLGISLLGEFFFRFPTQLPRLHTWSRSQNPWVKRGACVSLIYSLRRGRALKPALKIAERLMRDPHDLVQKGYGWMLKEASRRSPWEVLHYVMGHRATMPRTAFRYAIEKLPPPLRRQAMLS